MLAAKVVAVALLALALDPCDGSRSASDGGAAPGVDAATAPVIDDVSVPQSATIDTLTGVAHITGSISFHDDFGTVTGVNILGHGTNGSIYRGAITGASPQIVVFDLSTPGQHDLDFSVFAEPGNNSARVARSIVVSQ
ncbi:MAG: hypothetical protein ABIP89_02065 [Polyangiaceae bacterium]